MDWFVEYRDTNVSKCHQLLPITIEAMVEGFETGHFSLVFGEMLVCLFQAAEAAGIWKQAHKAVLETTGASSQLQVLKAILDLKTGQCNTFSPKFYLINTLSTP